jgi:hypothetical protein
VLIDVIGLFDAWIHFHGIHMRRLHSFQGLDATAAAADDDDDDDAARALLFKLFIERGRYEQRRIWREDALLA